MKVTRYPSTQRDFPRLLAAVYSREATCSLRISGNQTLATQIPGTSTVASTSGTATRCSLPWTRAVALLSISLIIIDERLFDE